MMRSVFLGIAVVASIALVVVGCGRGGHSPAPVPITVGGTVSGLSGTLVLQNNSGDDLTLTSNGTFVFATSFEIDDTYSVTCLTPSADQDVTITCGSGTITGSCITDVSVVCTDKAWTHPTGLTDNISPDGTTVNDPRVAMSDNDEAVIVWAQNDGSSTAQIFKSEYRDGSWSHPSGLTDNISTDGQGATQPEVAMDADGNTTIAWFQSDGSDSQIFKSDYRNGTWTHPSGLTDNISPDGQDVGSPEIAMDANGNTVIVWHQNDGSRSQIFMSEYRSGAWTHPSSLTDNISPDGQHAMYPEVAMDVNGNAIITWYQSDGSYNQIFKSEYRNGYWTHPSGLTDNISPDGQHASIPEVAMDDNGNAIITWFQNDGSNTQIFKSEYRSGTWTHPTGLTDNISPDGANATYVEVAMDNNGNSIIAWMQNDGSDLQIFKSEYRSGSWTHPSGLTDNISPDGQDANYCQVAMDNNGKAFIVWQQSDGTYPQVFKSDYRGGSWSHPSALTEYINPDGWYGNRPHVAADNNYNSIIVWYQPDGSDLQAFMSEYR